MIGYAFRLSSPLFDLKEFLLTRLNPRSLNMSDCLKDRPSNWSFWNTTSILMEIVITYFFGLSKTKRFSSYHEHVSASYNSVHRDTQNSMGLDNNSRQSSSNKLQLCIFIQSFLKAINGRRPRTDPRGTVEIEWCFDSLPLVFIVFYRFLR